MSIVTPPPITPTPQPAPQRSIRATFSGLVDAFVLWLSAAVAQFSAVATNVFNNATETYNLALLAMQAAADAASSAIAASSAANVVKWVSGTTYTDGTVVWSPTDHFPYRRVGTGAGTTDPKLDAVNWAIQLLSLGMGGQVITGNISLTSTSPAAIVVTPSGFGLGLFLPDATTCQQSVALFSIYNAGTADYAIRDFTGATLGWIRPGSNSVIGLAANIVATGTWLPGSVAKVAQTARVDFPSLTGSNASLFEVVPLDATRTFIVFGAMYGIVYDSSNQSWGSAVLLRTNGNIACAVLAAANKILVASCTGAGGAAIEVMAVSIAGVVITTNSPASVAPTLAAGAALTDFDRLVAVGTGFAFSYGWAGGSAVRGVSLSGTAPTVGAELSFSASFGGAPRLYVTGSTLRAVGFTSSGAIGIRPYTLAGAVLTLGTPAAISVTSANYSQLWSFVNGNGNIFLRYTDANGYAAVAVSKLTAVVEVATTASPFGNVFASDCAYQEVSAGKVVLSSATATGAALVANIAIDTAGTVSVGTAASVALGTTIASVGIVDQSSSTVRFFGGDASTGVLASFDCSGASPVFAALQRRANLANIEPNTNNGLRSYDRVTAGSVTYAVATRSSSPKPFSAVFDARGVKAEISPQLMVTAGKPGNAANETWALYVPPNGNTATIRRIEAAA